MISSTRRLDILCLAGIGRRTDDFSSKLPSWALDLTDTHLSICGIAASSKFAAALDLEADCSFSSDSVRLRTRGVVVGTITRCIRFPDKINPEVNLEAYLEDLCKPFGQSYSHPTGLPRLQVFFRTLVNDLAGEGFGRVSFANLNAKEVLSFVHKASHFLAMIILRRPGSLDNGIDMVEWLTLFEEFSGPLGSEQRLEWDFEEVLEHADIPINFLAEWYGNVMDRTVFVTEKGYMGIGLDLVAEGDEICVLPGCNAPLVLRRIGDEFELVGDCYAYGIMKDEIIQEVRDGKLWPQDIIIR